MKKILAALFTGAIAATSLATAPAHAIVELTPDVWAKPYTSGTLTAETLDCKTIRVSEERTDRATRFYRVENRFPAPSTAAVFPNQEHVRMTLPAVQHGWNVVFAWTTATPDMDEAVVLWVPACDADRNPQTT